MVYVPFAQEARIMSRVIVDESLRAKLNGLQEKTELCDEAGQTLGLFLPEEQYWKLQLAADGCPLTYEELQRRRQEKGGRTLAEIWKSLGQA
jgi:hypothetical protein